MFTFDDDGEHPTYSYFEGPAPYVDDSPYSYTGSSQELEHRRNYQWDHAIAEIFGAIWGHGLTVCHFEEHDWTPFQQFAWMVEGLHGWVAPPGGHRLPLSYTLLAQKP